MSNNLIKVLVVPSLGLSVEEVTVVGWLINEGDSFESGDEICALGTEKTVNVMEAPFSGTGRNGRISRRNVNDVLKESGVSTETARLPQALVQAPALPDVTEKTAPLSPMRRKIANRLQQSKLTIPHYRLVVDVKMDALMHARQEFSVEVIEMRS